jgi:large conductance mechanosensitive channel
MRRAVAAPARCEPSGGRRPGTGDAATIPHRQGDPFMGIIQEFKEFAVKGNAVDMAVGIILGAAFGKVVSSLVNDVIMPPLGMVLGGTDFSKLMFVLKAAGVNEAGQTTPEVAVKYGLFINNVIDFLIVAFAMFMVVKVMNRLIKQREKKAA